MPCMTRSLFYRQDVEPTRSHPLDYMRYESRM